MADSSQRIGKSMLYAMWILIFIVLAYFSDSFLNQQGNPNQKIANQYDEEGKAVVILKRNRQGHYVTTGKINGQKVTFLLDTGATMVSVPEKVATQLQLPKGARHGINTANGFAYAYRSRLDTVEIGAIKVTNISASINPNVGGKEILLGMSVLKHLEFTQRGNTLTLRQY